MTTKTSVHDHYVRCTCDALYSNPIEKCPACGKPNPELASQTLNAKEGVASPPASDPNAPTLNGKDPA